ncbi:molybdenum cofactor guanylyltransferase [Litoribacter alkaliphilus]|uniref:Molybdenum cofactor guanylyltransferase n=1 Tax=Litoribacter ruber TaxID=702568 RepID=A0AAP2CIT8_9BACT|nr:molybdenum cofactor guanylyltransferase [Litoribacter alkaliphilus]MBS9524459.1 molybdenum cofactor guanylyltransferase [Litoribacter alkaliphilus]
MKESIEVFVLSGGKSSRMGEDKGLLKINGLPMINYILDTVKQVGYSPQIIANDAEYLELGFPVLEDKIREMGPMGGLFTALSATQANHVMLLSCDTPNIRRQTLTYLIAQSEAHKTNVCRHKGKIYIDRYLS